MCRYPLTIKNPNYGLGHLGINALTNTIDTHIQVPCGSCDQCASLRQCFFMQRVQMESLRSHLFFFTLTYNSESIVHASLGEYCIAYPVFSDIQNMFKRIRKQGYLFRYTVVSEYGKKYHRPHFHGLLAVPKYFGDWRSLELKWKRLLRSEWRRNYGSNRSPVWRDLSTDVYKNCRNTTFDLHYVEPVRGHDNDVSFYVSKYITKYDKWIRSLIAKISLDPELDCYSLEEVNDFKALIKPRCTMSKGFGDYRDPIISEYIDRCAKRPTLFRYPQFIDIHTGTTMPMSPYYGKHCVGFEHLYNRLLHSDEVDNMSTNFYIDNSRLDDILDRESFFEHLDDWNRTLDKISSRCLDF